MSNEEDFSTAELAVLGSCFCSPEAAYYAYQNVEDEHFLDKKNRMLFRAIKRTIKNGMPVDPVTIQTYLNKHEKSWLPNSLIIGICEKVPTALNIRHYSEQLKNKFYSSKLNENYEKLKADPFDLETQKEVSILWDRINTKGLKPVLSLKQASLNYVDTLDARRKGQELRVLTGYKELDLITGGFCGGNLIAIGARTSLGKTSLLLNLALKFLKRGYRILFISAEMIFDEILDRMISIEGNIFISKLRRADLTDFDYKSVNELLGRFHEYPMWCLEGGDMSINRVRQAIDACNPSVVFVDFIQRFTPPTLAVNRAAYYSDLANEFKALAMDKKMVVFCASQLNRDIEKDGGRDPELSDFKESGGIEEAADIAILLQAKKKEETIFEKKITLHICKHRNGPTGKINYLFIKARTMFIEEDEMLISSAMQNEPKQLDVKTTRFDDIDRKDLF